MACGPVLLLYLLWGTFLFWWHCRVPTLLYVLDSLTFVLHRCFGGLGNLVLEITFSKHRIGFIHTVVELLIMTMVIYVAENLANRSQCYALYLELRWCCCCCCLITACWILPCMVCLSQWTWCGCYMNILPTAEASVNGRQTVSHYIIPLM